MFKVNEENVKFGIKRHPNNPKWAVITAKVMFGNDNLFESIVDKEYNEKGDYYIQLVIPKSQCDISEFDSMFDNAMKEKFSDDIINKYKENKFKHAIEIVGNKAAYKFVTCIKDGDLDYEPNIDKDGNDKNLWKKGYYLITPKCSNKYKPGS